MELIKIYPDMIEWARNFEKKILDSETVKTTDNKTGVELPDRYFVGFLGELAFLKFLCFQGKDFTYGIATDGKSHAIDFTCRTKTGNAATIDVKTTRNMKGDKINFKNFNPATAASIFVIIRLNLEASVATICGYRTRSGICECPASGPNNLHRSMPFTDLRGIEKLMEQLT